MPGVSTSSSSSAIGGQHPVLPRAKGQPIPPDPKSDKPKPVKEKELMASNVMEVASLPQEQHQPPQSFSPSVHTPLTAFGGRPMQMATMQGARHVTSNMSSTGACAME